MPAGLLEDAEVYLEVCEAESNRRKVPVKLEITTLSLEKYHLPLREMCLRGCPI
jgi:hypothetical protein